MKTVLVFAGTTEGRKLVEICSKNQVDCHVCVATEYGKQMIQESENVHIHTGRLDAKQMRELMEEIGCELVVDATHPYAVVVTEQIKKCVENTNIQYLRLLRKNGVTETSDKIFHYKDIKQCALALERTTGNILLTTGSKQLKEFTAIPGLKERLIARVIPGMESLELCREAGLSGKQIIAMQGPFSKQLNEAIIQEYHIAHLVTKESGMTGGVNEKLAAAYSTDTTVHVITRPEENGEMQKTGISLEETVGCLEQLLETKFEKGTVHIQLAGIGPGNAKALTKEVEEAIYRADVIFGAQRMLDSIPVTATTYPYYRKDDILPVIYELCESSVSDIRVAILFSGDTGFYSGCKKMYEALRCVKGISLEILPGISSVSMLCAKLKTDWQDGNIISLHGIEKEQWIPLLKESVKYNKKTFFITSGVEDIRLLGNILEKNCTIYLGYQLSYQEEQILRLTPEECTTLEREGLYTGVILSEEISSRYLVPILQDDFFIRDQVPMTKEEIRKLSICHMHLKENDVVYDIGSGTGSVAVQMALLSSSVKVYAMECNPLAVDLIKKNIQKAELNNVTVIEAMAPQSMELLPPADAAFIGGSKGNLREIVNMLYQKNASMRVVINALSFETICETKQLLEAYPICDLTVEQISVNRMKKLGEYNLLSANNPVFIFSFAFCPKE